MSKTGNPIKHGKPNANGKLRGLKEGNNLNGPLAKDAQMDSLCYLFTCFVTQTRHSQEASYRADEITQLPWCTRALRSGRAIADTQQIAGNSHHFQSCQGNPTPARSVGQTEHRS